jgi:hypothetical protein
VSRKMASADALHRMQFTCEINHEDIDGQIY